MFNQKTYFTIPYLTVSIVRQLKYLYAKLRENSKLLMYIHFNIAELERRIGSPTILLIC